MYKTLRHLAIILKQGLLGRSLRPDHACWFCIRWLACTLFCSAYTTVSIVTFLGGRIHLRTHSSDLDVFLQHIVYQELFNLPTEELTGIHTIVDAGANIGLSSLVLARIFPQSTIFAIEPESSNCDMFSRNCRAFMESGRIRLLRGAFYPHQAALRLITTGRQHWNLEVREADVPSAANTWVIDLEMVEREVGRPPDFVKMDIEGTEVEFFRDDKAFATLLGYGCLLVELHSPNAYVEFFSRISSIDFDSLHKVGEYWLICCPAVTCSHVP